MGIGVSVFLLTIGAILKFAITVRLDAVNIQMMGTILMIVGGAWFVMSLLLLRRGTERQNPGPYRDSEVSDREPPAV